MSPAETTSSVNTRRPSSMKCRFLPAAAGLLALLNFLPVTAEPEPMNSRRPKTDADLRFWLENMVWYHRLSVAEIQAATGLSDDEITAALARFEIGTNNKPKRSTDAPRRVPSGARPRGVRSPVPVA